jgi:hypothetical protein
MPADFTADDFVPPRPGERGWDAWIDYCADVEAASEEAAANASSEAADRDSG